MSSKSLVLARSDARTATVAAEAIAPELRITPGGLIANDPTLSYVDRRKLIKIEVQARCQLLKDSLDTKIRIEQSRLRKNEDVALAAISAYGDRLIYQIRDDFTKTLKRWGLRVNVDQLRLLTDFGEQLTTFKQELKGRKLEPKYRKVIVKSVDAAFEHVTEQLGNLAQGIFGAATVTDSNG
jgi:hypothetical protein